MIAMIHQSRWMQAGPPLRFPKGTEELFANSLLKTVAEFIDGPIDHIGAPQGYKFEDA